MSTIKALLSATNYVDAPGTTVTAEDQAGDLTPNNVKRPSPFTRWRSGSEESNGVTRWIEADFGEDVEIGVIAGAFSRRGGDVVPASTDTIQAQLDPSSGSGGNGAVLDVSTLASTVDPHCGTFLYKPASPITGRYLRLTLTLAASKYIELGRLWAGPVASPEVNVAYPFEQQRSDMGRAPRSPRTGIIRPELGLKPREVAFQWAAADDTEAEALLDAQRIAGMTGQVLFCWEPDSPTLATIFGRVASLDPSQHWSFDLNSQAFRIVEDL